MTNKQRVEIPERVAAQVLFLSDRTCCVCRVPRKPVQIDHLDEDPSNCVEENLVVAGGPGEKSELSSGCPSLAVGGWVLGFPLPNEYQFRN